MKTVRLSHPTKILNGTINLPASKSMSNRALILQHVIGSTIELQNLSTADDTLIMQQALQQGSGIIYVKNAGTCMRFLTAYFAAKQNCDVQLLCDERMEKRPIAALVNALTQLGANITYLKEEGFPPLNIKGKQLNGGNIKISATTSSQFVSSLMMIAPLCKTDLTIELVEGITSQPYIDMTGEMMQNFGIDIVKQNSNFEFRKKIQPQKSKISILNSQFVIESDWSAASYWYEMVALSKDAEITLPHLSLKSLQGDCVIAEHMKKFGVETIEIENGIILKKYIKCAVNSQPNEINLVHHPDLAPTLAAVITSSNSQTNLIGLQNLAIKESNRLQAITTELTKLGLDITSTENALLINFNPSISTIQHQPPHIATYSDHRMAMAFAPLALVYDEIVIENPDVVEKSYPHFWDDLKTVGFKVELFI